MVRISLEVEGAPAEVHQALRKLALGAGQTVPTQTQPAAEPVAAAPPESAPAMPSTPAPAPATTPEKPPQREATPVNGWSADHVRILWARLAPNAKQMISTVAHDRGFSTPRRQLSEALEASDRQLATMLSSVGHGLNRIAKEHMIRLPRPIMLDKDGDRYYVRQDFGEAFIRMDLEP